MIITIEQLAAHRNFCPLRFAEFAARPENQKFLDAAGNVSTWSVDDLVRAYREFVGERTLTADRTAIFQCMTDRR